MIEATDARTAAWEALVAPRRVAVVGASEDRFYARNAVRRLQRSRLAGAIALVNPNRESAFGLRCAPSLADVDEPVDAALIAVRAERTEQAVRDCAAAGVRAAVVVASGVTDACALRRISDESGMLVLGPSSLGVLNVADGIELFAGSDLGAPLRGTIGVASQSGGLLLACVAEATRRGLGFTHLVAVGEGVCTSVEDVVEHLVDDERTEVVCAVAEELRDPDRFVRASAAAGERGKPLVVLKLGRSDATARLAVSHTGAITGFDAFYDAFLADVGVLRAGSVEEMLDSVTWIAATPRRFRREPRGVAIVSLSGGVAGVAADALAGTGVAVPEFDGDLAALSNPLELGRQAQAEDPHAWERVLDAVAADPRFDALLALDLDVDPDKARSLARWRERTGKIVALAGNSPALAERDAAARDLLHELELPAPVGPVSAARGLGAWAALERGWRSTAAVELRDQARPAIPPAARGATLADDEARALLREFGVPGPRERRATTEDEAVAAAETIGYRVVLKVAADGLAHRTELGLVRVGLRTAEEVAAAAVALLPHGRLLVQELVTGLELLVSADNTRGHAPLVVVSRGGELVELERDRVFAVAPVGPRRARRLVDQLAVAPVLHGYRGRPSLDVDAVCAAVEAVGRLALERWDEVAVVEVNPLVVRPRGEGAIAVDALVELREGRR